MKSMSSILSAFLLVGLQTILTTSLSAQAIATEKSAKAAAASDAQFIAGSIKDNEDVMFLSQKAIDRAAETRIKELAQQMLEDHTTMLYTMQQLKAAGHGSSNQSTGRIEDGNMLAAQVNARLSGVSGADFDTMWVSSLLIMHQAKYDALSKAKEAVTNPRLKMAITEATPVIRKHLSQLKLLQKYLTKMAMQKKKDAEAQPGR